MYEAATKVNMLHRVGCTIVAYKLNVYIDVRYINMFIDMGFHIWAWGCTVVILLYHALGEATFETRKFTCYMGLFQV